MKLIPIGSAILLAGLLSGPAAHAQMVHEGRLLASGCFQCHGTDGKSGGFEKLAGMSRSEMLKELNEMRTEAARKDIMNPHARGYTTTQLSLIADYFASVGSSGGSSGATSGTDSLKTSDRKSDDKKTVKKKGKDD